MLRPEVVERLDCPIVGLATSWSIGRKGVPLDNLEAVRTLFERKFWPFPKGKIRKSNSRASSLRELGNATYKKAPNEPGKALELYNQSICMAEEGSTDLGLAYANRSAVYFNRKLYRECLDNIALARNHNYPSQMMSKLVEREKRAKQFLENDVDNSSPSESSTTTKNSTIKSFLALSEDRRCLITTRYMEAGEKVLLEKPFVLVVEPELAYQRCDYCAATKKHSLIPCKGCTAVMYCNEECQAQAFQRYHQFECEIVDDLHLLFRGPKATRMFHVILRLFWQAILLLLEDPKKFLKCVAPAERERYFDPFPLDPSDYVLHLFARTIQEGTNDLGDQSGICLVQFIAVVVHVIAVEENVSLWSRLKGKVYRKQLIEWLYRLLQSYSHFVVYKIENVTCFYPFTNMLSLGLPPNAKKTIDEQQQSIVELICEVDKGREIIIPCEDRLAPPFKT